MYGKTEGIYNLEVCPSFTHVGTYTVYYKVSKEGYDDVTGSFTITINKTTGIEDVNNGFDTDEEKWYDLNGRRLNGKPIKKGVYIMNGKKRRI